MSKSPERKTIIRMSPVQDPTATSFQLHTRERIRWRIPENTQAQSFKKSERLVSLRKWLEFESFRDSERSRYQWGFEEVGKQVEIVIGSQNCAKQDCEFPIPNRSCKSEALDITHNEGMEVWLKGTRTTSEGIRKQEPNTLRWMRKLP